MFPFLFACYSIIELKGEQYQEKKKKMERILPATDENLKKGAEILRKGGLVAFPTETVYGLGANVFLPQAVARIFEVKRRPHFDPLIVHISHHEMVSRLFREIPPLAEVLMEKFWPGPLTLVLPKKEEVPDIVTAGLPTVAVRMPDNPVALKLIEWADTPVAAPSANRFGHLSPTQAEEVAFDLGEGVDLILDGGKTKIGVESTVIMIERERVFLLRPGGLSVEEIEKWVGKVETPPPSDKILSPGTLKKHYAPQIPLYLFEEEIEELLSCELSGVVIVSPFPIVDSRGEIRILSENRDMKEVASNLFTVLRELEKGPFRAIISLTVEEKGLGKAIMDRLKRASSGYVKIKDGKLVL